MSIEETNRIIVRAIERFQEVEIEELVEAAVVGSKTFGKAYTVLSPSQLKAKVAGTAGGLTKYVVQRLRKELLTLMSNLKKVKNYREADGLKKAIFRWRDHYEEIIAQMRSELEARLRQGRIDKSISKASEDWANYYLKNQKEIWSLKSILNEFPMENIRIERHAWRGTGRYGGRSKEQMFDEFKKSIKKWDGQVKRRARAAWKWLDEFVAWTERGGFYGGGGEPLPIKHPGKERQENVSMEGFSVQLNGYDSSQDFHVDNLKKFQRGLAYYKKRAAKVFPWLLRHKLPFVLMFEELVARGSVGHAASYEHDHINITPWAMTVKKPAKQAEVFAHEMGHHIYRTVLSGKMKSDWERLLRATEVDLDLRSVLAKRRPGEKSRDFEKRIKKEDPVLSLQLDTLYNDPRYKYKTDLHDIDDFENYIKNNDPIIRVPGSPVSGYAAKNSEEAFCEALARLVAWGPRAMMPDIRASFRIMFPRLKMESAGSELSKLLSEALVS